MKMTEEVQRTGLPSLLQIQYLMELERIGWKRGAVMEIAEKCGVSHPAISRYLKSCCEKGILNEKYEFTVTGKMMLERYRKLLDDVLEWGSWPVCITIYQAGSGTEQMRRRSMADRGFERQAILRHNKRGSWLELSIRTMNAMSRVDHAEMEGKLSSLKYECNGRLHKAEIRGNKVNIPLEACWFAQNSRGIIKGRVAITVTCSVGCAHMPESTALLIFWL